MASIPATSFAMGCTPTDASCASDESPQHNVSLSTFAIDTAEVTVAQYKACYDAGTCTAPANSSSSCLWGKTGKDSYPINCVTWAQASAFCSWTATGARLPTESEWERAARSTDGRLYPWGSSAPDCSLANFTPAAGTCFGSARPDGSFPSGNSADGLKDLAGNVREWTGDWYDTNAYTSASASNPTGPATGTLRVVRGGGYADADTGIRAGARLPLDPTTNSAALGFRCARPLP